MTTSTTTQDTRASHGRFVHLALLLSLALLVAGGAGATDGPVLAYHAYGHGSEKVLVLHSWMDDSHSFDHVKPYLDTETFTFAFADLRGYGSSRHIEGEYTASEAARDAVRLADALGWGRFHVVGHSMSGMIVQRLAIDDWKSGGKRLKSVVAVTPVSADGYPADEPTRAFLASAIHDFELSKQLVSGLTGARLLPVWSEIVAAKNLSTSRPDAMKAYYEMWINDDFAGEAAAARVETPIGVIGGRRDLPGFHEEDYRRTFGAWYPNVELRFIEDAGHFPMYETTIYFATLLDELLRANSDS